MRIVFRFECGGARGYGHAFRCAALWSAFRVSGEHQCDAFVQGSLPSGLFADVGARIHAVPRSVASNSPSDSSFLTSTLGERADWIVVDHYDIDASWHSRVRPMTRWILVLDDLANRIYDADALVDPTWGTGGERYTNRVGSTCAMLCGSSYAILRPEFAEYRQPTERSMASRPGLRVHLFLGGAASMQTTIELTYALAAACPDVSIDVVPPIGQSERPQLPDSARWIQVGLPFAATMSACDVAVGAPGMATWERACVGLPGIYSAVSDSQVAALEHLAAEGFCHYVGRLADQSIPALAARVATLLQDRRRLQTMRETGMKAVDGLGAHRVVAAMQAMSC